MFDYLASAGRIGFRHGHLHRPKSVHRNREGLDLQLRRRDYAGQFRGLAIALGDWLATEWAERLPKMWPDVRLSHQHAIG